MGRHSRQRLEADGGHEVVRSVGVVTGRQERVLRIIPGIVRIDILGTVSGIRDDRQIDTGGRRVIEADER